MATRASKTTKPKTTRKAGKVTRRRGQAAAKADPPVVDALTLRGASEAQSIDTQEPARNQLAEDVERFLAKGGRIEEVPRDYRADPPKRPENNYGRGSI